MFVDMAQAYGMHVHPRKVARSSLSFVLPNNGKRAILRARDDNYLQRFPRLDISEGKLIHLDGHMADAALHYAEPPESAACWCRSTAARYVPALRS